MRRLTAKRQQNQRFELLVEDFRDILIEPPPTRSGQDMRDLMNSSPEQAKAARATLSRSHVFALGDDFTEAAARFSCQPASVMLKAIDFCRMPFDTIWLEWDDLTRRRHCPDGNSLALKFRQGMPRRRGLLIDTIEQSKDVRILRLQPVFGPYNVAAADRMPRVFLPLVSYEIYLGDDGPGHGAAFIQTLHEVASQIPIEKRPLDPDTGKPVDAFVEWTTEISPTPMGNDYIESQWGNEPDRLAVMQLMFRTGVASNLLHQDPMAIFCNPDREYRENLQQDLFLPAGDARFALSVLALLTDNAGETLRMRERAGGNVTRAGRFIPKYEYKVIGLVRPVNERLITLKEAVISHRPWAGVREHDVEGHWCFSHRTGLGTCEHAGWGRIFDAEGQQLGKDLWKCTACGKHRWWRDAHKRGDPAIGVLDKGYEVTTEKRAA